MKRFIKLMLFLITSFAALETTGKPLEPPSEVIFQSVEEEKPLVNIFSLDLSDEFVISFSESHFDFTKKQNSFIIVCNNFVEIEKTKITNILKKEVCLLNQKDIKLSDNKYRKDIKILKETSLVHTSNKKQRVETVFKKSIGGVYIVSKNICKTKFCIEYTYKATINKKCPTELKA